MRQWLCGTVLFGSNPFAAGRTSDPRESTSVQSETRLGGNAQLISKANVQSYGDDMMTIDRRWIVRGAWFGLLLIAAAYFLFQAPLPFPVGPHSWLAPLMRHLDLTLLGMLVYPTALLLFAAGAAAVRRRDAARFVSMAVGAAVAAIALVATVVAGMGVIAWMI
jgi:hypothetical protein